MNNPLHKQIFDHVNSKVGQLQHRLLRGDPAARADAANLRRAVTKPAGSVPEAFQATLGGLPEDLVGRTDSPSRGETVAHLAITLFAVHAQSGSDPVHVPNIGLGSAVRAFIIAQGRTPSDGHPILRRFNSLMTADSLEEASQHLRGMIQQFRGQRVALDYAQLARDLWFFANRDTRDGVRLQWGRDLHRAQPAQNSQKQTDTAVQAY